MPSSVNNWTKVNWVGRNMKAFGFSSWTAWVVGLRCREEITGSLKPLGGPTKGASLRPRQDATAGSRAAFRPGSGPIRGPQPSAGRLIPLSVDGIPASAGRNVMALPRFCSCHVLYLSLTISLTYSMPRGQARARDRAHGDGSCARLPCAEPVRRRGRASRRRRWTDPALPPGAGHLCAHLRAP
jgi:hypothetical protein